ncbi:pyruvate formate lyase activating enzyme [Lachnospiraceae bacterium XBB2008]|nr:pyruvate formate lyase activating enzyme [Lachnospiraceae bacterium XBB2008]
MTMAKCDVCFRQCEIAEGSTGFCGARICAGGTVRAANYGRVTSMALDPIEKKPLNRFYPGSMIVSVGSYGCNLRCPFCQNDDISWGDMVEVWPDRARYITPEELADLAEAYRDRGNIGVAYTYNEPLIGYEFVRDTARLVHERGMKNVLVSNGCASRKVLDEIGPYIDAMNIDLKGFTDEYYRDDLQGSRQMVMEFIEQAVKICHVELTTLIVPGKNDSVEEMRKMVEWVSSLTDGYGNICGENIPYHVSRFFPRFHMSDRDATDVALIYRLADTAREKLKYVYTGNC